MQRSRGGWKHYVVRKAAGAGQSVEGSDGR